MKKERKYLDYIILLYELSFPFLFLETIFCLHKLIYLLFLSLNTLVIM